MAHDDACAGGPCTIAGNIRATPSSCLWMTALLQDLRLAIRQLRRSPVFMATAALTLAVGLGVNAVAFSVVNALLFKVSDTRDTPGAGRIVTTPGGDEGGNGSLAEF